MNREMMEGKMKFRSSKKCVSHLLLLWCECVRVCPHSPVYEGAPSWLIPDDLSVKKTERRMKKNKKKVVTIFSLVISLSHVPRVSTPFFFFFFFCLGAAVGVLSLREHAPELSPPTATTKSIRFLSFSSIHQKHKILFSVSQFGFAYNNHSCLHPTPPPLFPVKERRRKNSTEKNKKDCDERLRLYSHVCCHSYSIIIIINNYSIFVCLWTCQHLCFCFFVKREMRKKFSENFTKIKYVKQTTNFLENAIFLSLSLSPSPVRLSILSALYIYILYI